MIVVALRPVLKLPGEEDRDGVQAVILLLSVPCAPPPSHRPLLHAPCVLACCCTTTAKAELAELAQKVDKVWAARLEQPDPLLQGCQREEVRLVTCSEAAWHNNLCNDAPLQLLITMVILMAVAHSGYLEQTAGEQEACCLTLCCRVYPQIQRRLDDWMESQIKQEGEKK